MPIRRPEARSRHVLALAASLGFAWLPGAEARAADAVTIQTWDSGEDQEHVEHEGLGAVHYLTKPADADDVLAAFARGEAAGAGEERGVAVPSLARVEWEHIHRVLTDCGGNVSRAARLLGIHRRSLQRKLAKFPVVR